MDAPHWIVTDLDETLLRNDSTVSPYTLATLDRIRSTGCKFAIATTRDKHFAASYIDLLQPDALVVSGGAVGLRGEKLVHYRTMDGHRLNELLDELDFLPAKRPTVVDSALGRYGDKRPVPRPFTHLAHQVIIWLNETLPQAFINRWKDSFHITTLWIPGLYRIAAYEATKLAALKTVLHGVDPRTVYTFGDDPMDAGMLAYFQGVAVANARAEARDAARYRALSNEEDGVAHWINEKFLL